jgi:hypothetical protein
MFDPVSPIRFENQVAGWNRTIKGSRNALNGAVDQGDEVTTGPEIDYNVPMFNVSQGDNGDIGIECWVLARPEAKDGKKAGSKPSRNFVDDAKPIVLTHNGQNQGELSGKTTEGFAYLAVVIDLYSRRVVGWSIQSRQTTDLVLQALLMAVWRRKPKDKVLVHSDQGSQFTSIDWASFLKQHNLEHSMSRRGIHQ